MPYLGELAALGTSLGFTLGPTLFALAGRRVGSQVVNRSRLLLTAPVLLLLHGLFLRRPLPAAGPETWLWLGASGLVGLVLGDACLFRAFVLIGPRLTMLLYSLYPLMSALLAYFFFDEVLRPAQWLAILVTLGGVAWVVSDRENKGGEAGTQRGKGILLAAGGALGQALGLILAREGMGPELPALSAHLIRMLVAAAGIWALALAQGAVRGTFRAVHVDRQALRLVAGGALFGPLLGVWLSLIAITNAEMGPASTLMALPPIFLLPIGRFVFKEKVGPRSVAGTLLAVAGALALILL